MPGTQSRFETFNHLQIYHSTLYNNLQYYFCLFCKYLLVTIKISLKPVGDRQNSLFINTVSNKKKNSLFINNVSKLCISNTKKILYLSTRVAIVAM
jgi:hypothetical protein